jgi:ATP/maltotriose-dependent transcriptional regulator MalT
MTAAHRDLSQAAGLAADGDPRMAVEWLSEAAEAAIDAGLLTEASESAELITRLAGHAGDETARFLADQVSGKVAWLAGDPDRAMALISRAISRLEAAPQIAASPRCQEIISDAWMVVGDFDRARRHADRALELAQAAGALGHAPRVLVRLAFLDNQTGYWPRALARATQAAGLAREAGQPMLACDALVTMAEIEAAQGRDDDARRHASEADQLSGELGLPLLQYLARRALALAELGRGRAEEAIGRYEEVRRLAARWQISHPYYSAVPDLIEAYARAGALGKARELLPEYLVQVLAGNPPALARAARCQGILAASGYDAHFQEAIAHHERGEVAFQHARTRLCYGEQLRRAQRRRDARAQLRIAAEIFDRLDARPWAERARAELRASGETITPAGTTEQLTPQELQIALLVAEGKTNPEIGRAIFLSTRTVEYHLSRTYRKLGLSSRAELARHLASAATPPRAQKK